MVLLSTSVITFEAEATLLGKSKLCCVYRLSADLFTVAYLSELSSCTML